MSIKVTVMSLDFESSQPPTTQVYQKDELSVGRSTSSDLVLTSPEISTEHARISIKNDGGTPRIYVTDLGSDNGTLIESKPLSPNVAIPMASHERIVIGNYLIKPEITKEKAEIKTMQVEETVVKDSKEKPILKNESAVLESEDEEVVIAPVISVKEPLVNGLSTHSKSSAFSKVVSGVLSEELEQVLTIEARELFALAGKITRKGQALSGVRIDAGSLGLHVTDEEGAFIFKNVPEDTTYRITASKQGYIFEEACIEGTLRSDEQLTLRAKKLLTLKGKVIHKGVSLAGVTIDGGPLGTTLTAADGTYVFRDVPEGTAYSVTARKDGYTFN